MMMGTLGPSPMPCPAGRAARGACSAGDPGHTTRRRAIGGRNSSRMTRPARQLDRNCLGITASRSSSASNALSTSATAVLGRTMPRATNARSSSVDSMNAPMPAPLAKTHNRVLPFNERSHDIAAVACKHHRIVVSVAPVHAQQLGSGAFPCADKTISESRQR